MTPIFSVVLAHSLTRDERLTINRMTGVLIGWIGVAALIGFRSLRGFGIEVIGQLRFWEPPFHMRAQLSMGVGSTASAHLLWLPECCAAQPS
jgi:hypothetical protein